jgi:hypothetical protein
LIVASPELSVTVVDALPALEKTGAPETTDQPVKS